MHVLINAASAHMGGAVTFLKNVLPWFARVAPDWRFTTYVPDPTKSKLAGVADRGVHLISYPLGDTSGMRRLYFDQVMIPRLIRTQGVDILFSTTGFGTFFCPAPEVLLVRNMAYFDPAFHARYHNLGRSLRKNSVRRWHSILSMRAADAVVFPSRAMQDSVGAYTTFAGTRVESIHYGFDHEAFSKTELGDAAISKDVATWKEEGYQVLLSVSTFAVQKNYETLVEALALLRRRGMKLKLLTTISREKTTDTAEYDALMARAGDLGVADDIVQLGYIPYENLGSVYRLADAYVFPSFTESFGHSMVEAMAAGLPVIAAGTPVNREVCGTAAEYFDTFSADGAAQTIANVLLNPELRPGMRQRSKERAADFSWKRCAEQYVTLFRELASSGPVLAYASNGTPAQPHHVEE